MYEIAKYHMRKDIKKVLDWQMKYGKSLKELARIYYELDNYNEVKENKPKTFYDLKILDHINEKNIPGLKISLYIQNIYTNNTNYLDIYTVEELVDLLKEKYNKKYALKMFYYSNVKRLEVILSEIFDRKKAVKNKIKSLKEMDIKTLVKYHTLTGRGMNYLINGPAQEDIVKTINDELNFKLKNGAKSYVKDFDSIDTFLKVDFEKIKSCNFSYAIQLYDDSGMDRIDGESTDEMINCLKSLQDDNFDTEIVLSKCRKWNEMYIHVSIRLREQPKMVYVKDLNIKKGFKNYTWSHGLNAFNSKDPISNIKKILQNPYIEIACSVYGEEIGPVGVYVKGDCKFASFNDVGSYVEKDTGFRIVNLINMKHELSKPEDMMKYSSKEIHMYNNSEGIITNIKIVGLWVRKYWIEDHVNEINKLKEITGLKEIEII